MVLKLCYLIVKGLARLNVKAMVYKFTPPRVDLYEDYVNDKCECKKADQGQNSRSIIAYLSISLKTFFDAQISK